MTPRTTFASDLDKAMACGDRVAIRRLMQERKTYMHAYNKQNNQQRTSSSAIKNELSVWCPCGSDAISTKRNPLLKCPGCKGNSWACREHWTKHWGSKKKKECPTCRLPLSYRKLIKQTPREEDNTIITKHAHNKKESDEEEEVDHHDQKQSDDNTNEMKDEKEQPPAALFSVSSVPSVPSVPSSVPFVSSMSSVSTVPSEPSVPSVFLVSSVEGKKKASLEASLLMIRQKHEMEMKQQIVTGIKEKERQLSNMKLLLARRKVQREQEEEKEMNKKKTKKKKKKPIVVDFSSESEEDEVDIRALIAKKKKATKKRTALPVNKENKSNSHIDNMFETW
jgi:hypothetical protein